jgi:hypothetical protein
MKITRMLYFLSAIVSCNAHAATVAFLEQTFTPGDWATTVISGSAGGQVASTSVTGGNSATLPVDPYWSVLTNTNSTTITGFSSPGFTYDFSAGAINQINFSLDYEIVNAFGQGQAFGLMAIQNGNIFQAADHITGSTASGWQHVSNTGLLSTDFTLVNGNSIDFSAGAGPITFGLFAGNSGGAGILIGYDNLSVELNTVSAVPVPAAAWLFGAGLLGLMGVARKRIAA